ncbi:ATPase, AAA-type, core [Niveomyces insectorum RCEF 264]|uniref:ATPase, AAA-type, core n=1 Tax=Niveomyces insectorum RCEF 264 TaxID=1081102 RepID=A0A167XUS0_9HYPO|nr:ATPase, AAA-type, core [Niveomyces insectorum RCEF 264]
MDTEGLIAEYERILGGKFLPKDSGNQQQTRAGSSDSPGEETRTPDGGNGVNTRDQPSGENDPPNDGHGEGSRQEDGRQKNDADQDNGRAEAGPGTRKDAADGKGKGKNYAKGKRHAQHFIPDLKKVVQFSDTEGKKHVIGLETYKFKTHRSRHTQVLAEAEDKPFRDYAILLKADVNDDVRGGIKADFSLEIQSDALKNIFRTVGKWYRELTLDTGAEPIVIQYPFQCLFFLRTKLRELQLASTTPPQTRRELANLVDFIHAPVGHSKIIETYNNLVPHGKITFPMVWTLYPPYEPVLALHAGQKLEDSSCYLVESVSFSQDEGEPYWDIQLLFGYHDGNHFYLKSTQRKIHWFDGVRDINQGQLDLLPLNLLEEEKRNAIRASLVRRGKLYVDYCTRDFSFMHYKGPVELASRDSEMQLKALGSHNRIYVDTRVIIDRTAESKVSNADDNIGDTVASCLSEHLATTAERQISLTSTAMPVSGVHQQLRDLVQSKFTGAGAGEDDEDQQQKQKERQQQQQPEHGGPATEPKERDGGTVDGDGDGDENDWMLDPKDYAPRSFELTDEDYMVCRKTVVAFLLDRKLWVFYVEIHHLREIEWKNDPFQSLQLSSDKKRLVHRLVKGFDGGSEQDTYDDLIEGKGKGLIFLLHGPPGLGKTLTAESVAESTKRPLYHVSTGELSIEVHDLENQLSEIFRLGARWNAVVLLDEADVLMSKRTTDDLRRNAIVAVFLRMLEYYRGMLFLTTNRHSDFDNAFYNRIHITIEYGELTEDWRTNIWREHLQRACRRNRDALLWRNDTGEAEAARDAARDDDDGDDDALFRALGVLPNNGRDIKNYVRTSLAFARAEDEDLGLDQVLVVLENNLPRQAVEANQAALNQLHALRDRQLRQKDAREARLAKARKQEMAKETVKETANESANGATDEA